MNNCHTKILDLLEQDQENIKFFREGKRNIKEMQKVSFEISNQFKDIVKLTGFPYKNTAPHNVYKAGVVLSLHLPPNDLRDFFENIESSSPEEFLPEDKAYFIDRLRIHAGKKQLYGTQVKKDKDGKIEIFPIEDKENVNKRRKKMGMETLKKYLENFEVK
jgi:hypothetical protein